MRYVILPQAVRRVGPPLLNDFIALQKDVALIAIIGVTGEAFRVAQIDASTDFNYTPMVAAALLYLAVTIPLARLLEPHGGGTERSERRRTGDASSAPVLEFRGVTKAFGERRVLHGIDLDDRRARGDRADRRLGLGQVDAAALRRPARSDIDDGDIFLDGEVITDPSVDAGRASAAGSGSSSRPTTCSRT